MAVLSLLNKPNLRVLCLGAHCDDIEIGCSGTLMTIMEQVPNAQIDWVVFSSDEVRQAETQAAAKAILGDASTVHVHRFRNGYFPYLGIEIKDAFEALKARERPDVIFTHTRDDRHQDHRLISDLTWNTFRDHFILEYEIPKYDGDFGQPNVFMPLSRRICDRKVRILADSFTSQRNHQWFSDETFLAVLRLRGIECNAADGLAEAYYCRKAILQVR